MKIQKILLLNPPDPTLWDGGGPQYSYFEPPLGLMYVTDYLKKYTDLTVEMVDLSIELRFGSHESIDSLLDELLLKFKPDLVAIAALYYNSLNIFHSVAAMVKARSPNSLVVMGGHYPTHMTADCLADPNVDYVILSEGELGLTELIEALNAGTDPSLVDGVAFRNGDQLVVNPRTTFWKGFADVGRLFWEDIPFDHYFKDSRNVLHRLKGKNDLRIAAITASRGCPNHCGFCSSKNMWRRRWRRRKVANVIDEIRYLMDRHGVNTIVFNDENIGVNKAWFLELLDALAQLNITWISSGGLSVRTLNDERVVDAMYRSGVGLFNLAFESTNDETLRKINKPLTMEESLNVIRLIREKGNGYITGFFISGFPFEKMEDVRNNLELAASMDIDWKCYYCFQPFPGTRLFDECLQLGLIDEFNANYGENYLAPQMRYIDFTPDQLFEENYLANLRANFLENRNLKLGTPKALDQALRDFKYVLDMVPGHVFAWMGMATIAERKGELLQRDEYLAKAKKALREDSFQWAKYLRDCGIDPENAFTFEAIR